MVVITTVRFVATRETVSKNKSRTTTAIRFPEDLHERLRQAADNFGLPINFLVVKAMEEFLERMIDPSEFRLTKERAG